MSDAEKLQEIKDAFEWGKENLEEGLYNLTDEQIEWLIKQAEKSIKTFG
jgi:hypothetical protein